MNNIHLSVLLLAKNEEKHIQAAIKSVAFADEIIVIDDFSDDQTKTLASQAGATVYQRQMAGDFAAQQNFAISKARGTWLLFLDCDERITPALATEIQTALKGDAKAYQIKRLNHFAGNIQRHGVLRPDWVTRLVPNQKVAFTGLVHQRLVHPFVTEKLKAPMLHYTYASWQAYFKKFEHYTRLAAIQIAKDKQRVCFFYDILLRPIWAFLKMYVWHLGFLDGKLGFLLCFNHLFYTQSKYVRARAYLKDPDTV